MLALLDVAASGASIAGGATGSVAACELLQATSETADAISKPRARRVNAMEENFMAKLRRRIMSAIYAIVVARWCCALMICTRGYEMRMLGTLSNVLPASAARRLDRSGHVVKAMHVHLRRRAQTMLVHCLEQSCSPKRPCR